MKLKSSLAASLTIVLVAIIFSLNPAKSSSDEATVPEEVIEVAMREGLAFAKSHPLVGFDSSQELALWDKGFPLYYFVDDAYWAAKTQRTLSFAFQ